MVAFRWRVIHELMISSGVNCSGRNVGPLAELMAFMDKFEGVIARFNWDLRASLRAGIT